MWVCSFSPVPVRGIRTDARELITTSNTKLRIRQGLGKVEAEHHG